ncbi:MAG TPA: flippase [bacterium]|nr:flippase [bacterium]
MSAPEKSGRLLYRVINNSGVYLVGDLFYRFVNFFSGVLIVRSLGSEAYGQYSFIYVFLGFFETFMDFGLNNILVREVAQRPEETPKLLGNAVLLRLILAGISIPLSWTLVSCLGYPAPVRFGVYLASLQLFLVFRSLFEIIFRLKLMMVWPAFWNGVRALLNFALIALAFYMHAGVPLFILAAIVSGFISMTGLIVFSLRFTPYSFQWDGVILRRLIRECWPLAASNILTLFCLRIDVILLSKLRGFAEVGLYNAALRITESFGILAISLMSSLYPLLSEAYLQDRDRFNKMIGTAYRVLLFASLPLAVGGFFTGRELIMMLFGAAYASSGTALVILLGYMTAYFIGNLLVNVLYACGRQILDVQITFFQICAAVAMNFLLIPTFGFIGAAMSTALGGFFAVLLMMGFIDRYLGLKFYFWGREAVLPGIINLFFFAVLAVFTRLRHGPVVETVFFGVFVYAGLLFLFRVLSLKELRQYFQHTLRKKNGRVA